jgi:hypothetical protein
MAGTWVVAVCEECQESGDVDGNFERPFREHLKLKLMSLVLGRLVHIFDAVPEAFDRRVKYATYFSRHLPKSGIAM